MPRKARLDAEGTVHHVMARGTDRRLLFRDNTDRRRFLERLERLVGETGIKVYAWTLLPNHLHLLVRSGPTGLVQFMRRLLTGYAVAFNLRHKRTGHLFQNRYKSVVCEEQPYFLELVRYIHLNPLRAHLVSTMAELDSYPWSGHRSLMARTSLPWQDRAYVHSWFSTDAAAARRAYRTFMEQGIAYGRRPDFIDRSRRRARDKVLSDDRVLGSGAFVKRLLNEADDRRKRYLSVTQRAQKMKQIIAEKCAIKGIAPEALRAGSRAGAIPEIRSELALELAHGLGISYAEIARHLGVSTAAISLIMKRKQRKLT